MKAKSGRFMTFLPGERLVRVSQDQEESVLSVGLRGGLDIDHTCGGNGTCGTCIVEVVEGSELLNERTEQELEMSEDRKFLPQERLSCQIHACEGLVVMVPRKTDLYKSK
ncbi:2Fe-2S ferredoxin [compost metagenome]